MNRRDFIKKAGVMGALTTWTVTCKYEEEHDPKGEKGEVGETGHNWNYRVYCYEREQGEWTFSQNIRGSFAYQREYMTFEEDDTSAYCGWMDGGKLHFASLDDATDFVDCHVRTKDDVNLIDSIYDVYFVNKENVEIKVAHYWFNGDTGREIHWVADKPYTDYSKVDCA
jgi:hypothetical protein